MVRFRMLTSFGLEESPLIMSRMTRLRSAQSPAIMRLATVWLYWPSVRIPGSRFFIIASFLWLLVLVVCFVFLFGFLFP